MLGAPLDHVPDQPHRRLDREAPLLLGDVLLEDVRLDRPPEPLGRDAGLVGRSHVEGEQDRRRGVDRHRGGHLAQVDAGEQGLHVVEGVDRHPLHPDLAEAAIGVGVEPHQGGHVEGGREAGLAV
jgi:hypothetical protein